MGAKRGHPARPVCVCEVGGTLHRRGQLGHGQAGICGGGGRRALQRVKITTGGGATVAGD